MSDWLLDIEEARNIRKHQTFLDPAWSADRENTMIIAGGKAEAKKLVEWLEAEMTRKWREIMEDPKAVLPMDNSLIDWEALKKEVLEEKPRFSAGSGGDS